MAAGSLHLYEYPTGVVRLSCANRGRAIVPLGGLGKRLDAMYDFHAQQGIKPQRGHGRHDANGAVIRWCFADPDLAAAFASEFRRQNDDR